MRIMVQDYLLGGASSKLTTEQIIFGYSDSNVLHLSDDNSYLDGSLVGFLDSYITPIFSETFNHNEIEYESGSNSTGKIKSINGLPFLNKKDQLSNGDNIETVKASATSSLTYISDDL